MSKVIISLFDHSGAWSDPYREVGYDVTKIDLKEGRDVMLLKPDDFNNVHGILAAPPCTHFSGSGARWWSQKDRDGRTAEAVRLVEHTLLLIKTWNPVFWALENPVGRLAKMVPSLGNWKMTFNPCDFGDPYTKRTCLWGIFNIPKKTWVPPTEGSKMHLRYGGRSERTKEMRSVTPGGFARAFFEANP